VLIQAADTSAIEYTLGTPHLPVLMVSNQEELLAGIPENCTTLINSIGLLGNYTGPFGLNGIINLAGGIFSIDLHDTSSQALLLPVPGLTTLVMEDLVSVQLLPALHGPCTF
jgi:hypothetical protein